MEQKANQLMIGACFLICIVLFETANARSTITSRKEHLILEEKQSANEEFDVLGHGTVLQDSVVRRKRTLQSLATFFSVGNCFLFFNCF